MFVISGKVALITGAASGIGLMYAKELLRNGLKGVTIADENEELGFRAVIEVSEEFGSNRAIFIKTDVSNKKEFDDAFKATVKTFKNIDILINNAGILNDFKWERQILVNINGIVNGCLLGLEEYLPKYKSGEEGIIVNISSITGLDQFGSIPIYTATKHAVIGLSRSLAIDLNYQRTKVKVLTLCPGVTDTALIDFSAPETKTLSPAYTSFLYSEFGNLKKQPAIFVARSMVNVIKEGDNGSVWLVEDELPVREITFTNRHEQKYVPNKSSLAV